MKNSPLTTILLAVLAISAVWSAVSCLQYIRYTREFKQLQAQVATIQSRQQNFQTLVNDTIMYSKTHPTVKPILKSIGIEETAPATTK